MKALTKGDITTLRWVQEDRVHQVRWTRRARGLSWTDHVVVVTPRCRRLVEAGMLVDPDAAHANHPSGRAELTALGARVLVVYAEHLREHRDADTALSRTTIDWQQGRL